MNLSKMLRRKLSSPRDPIDRVLSCTFPVRDLKCLKQAMGWQSDPILDFEHLYEYQYLTDLNERRIRDAEVIGAACCNQNANIVLEIGTAEGRTTAVIATNTPNGLVYTVNIPPEEAEQGGRLITSAIARETIGHYYRKRGLKNIRQILANTAEWEPDFGPIDIAFIDGCHDADFVYQDTVKVLQRCQPGSIILWHDFAPELANKFEWIKAVCLGVAQLLDQGHLKGSILHLRDSWTGLYQVPTE